MKIFALETSCDETAAAIVEDGTKVHSDVVVSSADLHQKTGGVVPEVAARKQVESIVPVIDECLKQAALQQPEELDALAVTVGPGLIGSLLVGVSAAKALSLTWKKPLVPINHLVGHIYGNFLDRKEEKIKFPAVVLIVSGGHTDLVLMRDHGAFEYLGGTLDDAAGEAFDKSARLLGLSTYLGGSELSKLAATCESSGLEGRLPRPMLEREDYDFSFSGLKTAVKRLVEREEHPRAEVACEFENAVVDVLVGKTMRAAKEYQVGTILLGGGVVANRHLRQRMQYQAEEEGISVFYPALEHCGDSASYIASAAYYNYEPQKLKKIVANPALSILG